GPLRVKLLFHLFFVSLSSPSSVKSSVHLLHDSDVVRIRSKLRAVSTKHKTKPKDGDGGEDPQQSKLRAGLDSAIVREKPNIKWTDVAAVLHRDGLGELSWLRLLLLKLTLRFFRESDSRVSDLDNGCGPFPHRVNGTAERPRMCVFRSNKHLYVQVIDDTKMHTLASASTKKKPISEEFEYTSGPTIVSSSSYESI
ncbi:unnamed protein product, partial [Brassica rapa]